jgi:hypothetical protein
VLSDIFKEIKQNQAMKKILVPILSFLMIYLSSCSLVGGIFKAGAYTGIIAVVVIIIVIALIIARLRKK